MNDDIAIKVEHVYKTFKLPHERQGSVKNALINLGRSKRGYERQHVLEDINFEIKKGEFFGIVGRNGSGKSTLLKLLAGIYTQDKGGITINGKLTPFIELGVGFNPELTGRENVFLNGALLGFNRKEMLAMYDDIVEFAELGRFMDQKLKNYSSGMQVRLAFSIAIRANTDILVLDEVLAVGDANFQRKCFAYFEELKRLGATVILVTHDMVSVTNFCNRAMLVDRGEIVSIGKSQNVASLYYEKNIEYASRDNEGATQEEVGIVSVSILDDDNRKVFNLVPRGEYTIKVKINNKKETAENLGVGFSIRNSSNTPVFGYNSYFDSAKQKGQLNKKGEHTISFSFKNSLKNGAYHLSVGIHEDTVSPIDGSYYLEPIVVQDNSLEFTSKGWEPPNTLVDLGATANID